MNNCRDFIIEGNTRITIVLTIACIGRIHHEMDNLLEPIGNNLGYELISSVSTRISLKLCHIIWVREFRNKVTTVGLISMKSLPEEKKD